MNGAAGGPGTTRRKIIGGLGALAAVSALPGVAAGRPLVLDDPEDNLTAWMKIRASLETQDVYFWFTGGLDLAVPGQPIAPIVGIESLLLRRTRRVAERIFHVTDWEATIYRDPVTGALADTIVNPVTGRKVQPLHYTEGPVPVEYRADRQPRLIGMDTPFETGEAPFRFPWRIAGGDIWMTKSLYMSDRPHWLDMDQWPAEAPAATINVASITTLKASLADVQDSRQNSVPTDMIYQATSGWLPWMLMGQRPGYVVWHEAGKKLFSLDEAPADTLAILREVHPQWFGRPDPWEGFTNLFLQYQAKRKPARP